MTKTERSVMERIIGGQRAFGSSREIAACRKLAERGLISVDFREVQAVRSKGYQFGRVYRPVVEAQAGALVKAPKVEAAIAVHGKEKLLKAL